jgi:hypothetical protein
MSANVVEERNVLPGWKVHVGWDYSWKFMWSHVVYQVSVPRNRGKILEKWLSVGTYQMEL